MIDFGSNQYRIGGFGASPFNYIGIDPNFTQLFGSNVILDASSATLEISSGLIKTTSGASNIKGLKLDFNNNVYSLGDTDDLNTLTKIKVDESSQSVIITGSLTTTGSVFFPFLIEQSQNNVVLIDTSTGQLYYTASSAIGGGGSGTPGGTDQTIQFNSASVFSGSAKLKYDYTNSNIILTGSLLLTQSYISKVDYIDFTPNKYDTVTPGTIPTHTEGRLFYDTGSQTLCMYNGETDVTLNIGQESWLRARNQTGVTITNGSVVRIDGAVGNRPSIALAQSADQVQTFTLDNNIIGIATHDIEQGTDGFVTTFGLVNGVNTAAFTAGDLLWVSQSAGQYTNVAPSAPFDKTFVGVVTRVNASQGSIFVFPDQPLHFHDISSVSQSGAYTQGDIWMFKASGSSGVWTNTKTLSGSYVISGSLTTNGGLNIQSLTASVVSASSFTGSLFGTASWAVSASQAISSSRAVSASFALTASIATFAITSSYPISVTGSGTTLYSVSPLANPNFGAGATHSIFFGQEAGYLASDAYYANFIGRQAGYQAYFAEDSNFLPKLNPKFNNSTQSLKANNV